MEKTRRKLIIYVISALIAIAVLSLVVNFFVKLSVKTETASYGSIEDFFTLNAVVIRDEITLESSKNFFLKGVIKDGEKVQKDGVLAKIYGSENDFKISKDIDDIQEEIKILKKLTNIKADFSKGFSGINNQINDEIKKMRLNLQKNEFRTQEDHQKKILNMLGEKEVYLGKLSGIKMRIEELEKRLKNLKISGNETVLNSPEAGCFFSFTDGFEGSIQYDNILSNNYLDFNFDLGNSQKTENTVGKIIKSSCWYLLCEASEEQCSKLFLGAEYNITFGELGGQIPCEVRAIKSHKDGSKIVIFSGGYMDKDLAAFRSGSIKVDIANYSGLKINKNVLHQDTEGNSYVHVKIGGHIITKKINPIFSDSESIICSNTPEEDQDRSYLSVGDKVVIRK